MDARNTDRSVTGTGQLTRRRFVTAAGAAAVAAAILIPVTAALTQNTTPSSWTVKPVYTWR